LWHDSIIPEPFQIRQCENPECGLRFPVVPAHSSLTTCPACGGAAPAVLTHHRSGDRPAWPDPPAHPPLEALLDNIRSAWNVGSLFRSADGAGFRHLHLCGFTATPRHPKVGKTALGAERAVGWTYWPNGLKAAAALKATGACLWALEDAPQAESLLAAHLPVNRAAPVVLVVGNETCGVDPEILALCERVLSIPMLGMKHSYNAAVAFGIAAHWLRFKLSARFRPIRRETDCQAGG
jgi:23S rRNA (guanosine2251-2'-O)-methyltransferase